MVQPPPGARDRDRALAPCAFIVRDDFLDRHTLDALAQVLDADPGDATEVGRPGTGAWRLDLTVRRAWEVGLPDGLHELLTARVNALRPVLEACFGVPLEPCDAVAALRYPPGAFYRTHRDATSGTDEIERRAVSIVIFVNDGAPARGDYRGGRLHLYGPVAPGSAPAGSRSAGLDAPARAGTLIAFPSDWLHEVTPVERGERRTVVAWLLRRP